MRWILIDCICFVVVSGAAVLLVRWFNVGEGLHVLFAAVGAFTFFFGWHLTGSGFWSRFHYVGSGTPEIIWKAMGIICWIVALISFFYHLP